MLPEKLKTGDVIGIVSPSHVAQQDIYRRIIANIERKGFRVKTGKNLYKDTYGYLASEAERAEDFNGMVLDQTVKMVFFGGGYGALEILPYIDYGAILRNPKIFLSYSDGTSILNAIYAKTGLTTYYGQTPGEFEDLRQYDYEQFTSNLVRGDVREFVPNSDWHSLRDGVCEGTLVGGYSWNIALLLNNRHFEFDPHGKYILFLEDYEKFSNVAVVSMLLSCIEQNPMIGRVSGLLFGHYSEALHPELMARLGRFGEQHGVPVAYCDDFGHGKNHAILPIGSHAILDTHMKTLRFD
ncbi:MAG TPA: LD-carboxypeptidase [Clostridia bacterium]|nr:LD-carboxypeptidase [Clostridia bacterium]